MLNVRKTLCGGYAKKKSNKTFIYCLEYCLKYYFLKKKNILEILFCYFFWYFLDLNNISKYSLKFIEVVFHLLQIS